MKSSFLTCLVVLALPVITGCKIYERIPLQATAHAAEWTNRVLDTPSVRDYAESVAASAKAASGAEPTFDLSDGLGLSEAEAIALHFNAPLRIARAEAGVPLASAREAGWWPDPQLEAEVLRFVNRGRKTRFRFDGPSVDGLNSGLLAPNGVTGGGVESTPPGVRRVDGDFIDEPWIVGASLSITVPVSGRLAVEKSLKWSEYDAGWRRVLVAEWELLTRLRSDWYEWSTTSKRIAITRDYLSRLESIADIAAQLAAAGEMKPTEARVLRIELEQQRAALIVLEGLAAQQALSLRELLGITPDAAVELVPSVTVDVLPLASDEFRDAVLAGHPRIKAAEAHYESAEKSLELEIRLQYPDLQLGPSFSFEEGFSRLGLGFGFPIPLWNRNRQGVAEAEAAREAARVRFAAEVEIVLSSLAQAQARLAAARERRRALLDTLAPLADRQLEDSRTLLELGEVDVLLLRDALTTSLATKLSVLDATLVEAQASNHLVQMLSPRWITPRESEDQEP